MSASVETAFFDSIDDVKPWRREESSQTGTTWRHLGTNEVCVFPIEQVTPPGVGQSTHTCFIAFATQGGLARRMMQKSSLCPEEWYFEPLLPWSTTGARFIPLCDTWGM